MEKSQIKATVVADSINEFGQRCTSILGVIPRIVLAELNTHRMLSRNSASSRAVPFEKMLERVQNDPFIPIKWMKDHPGMQGNEYFEDENAIRSLNRDWLDARDYAIHEAKQLSGCGLTKQIVNRLLEPFQYHQVLITATEWENFFALRCHEAAEIHIQDFAYKILEAMNNSTPKSLKSGEWHIPFGDKIDIERLISLPLSVTGIHQSTNSEQLAEEITRTKIKIATARCARTSYINYEGKDDYEVDIKLYDRLASMGHYSPFEHCARSMNEIEYFLDDRGNGLSNENAGWCGNFRGFIQLRKTFQNENMTDSRLLKKNYEQVLL